MRSLPRRMLWLTLMLSVLLPLELAPCAFMTAGTAHADADEHAATPTADHDCCPGDEAPNEAPSPPPCCCPWVQLPAATAAAKVTVPPPVVDAHMLAILPLSTAADGHAEKTAGSIVWLQFDSPPESPCPSHSPRSPPYSA